MSIVLLSDAAGHLGATEHDVWSVYDSKSRATISPYLIDETVTQLLATDNVRPDSTRVADLSFL